MPWLLYLIITWTWTRAESAVFRCSRRPVTRRRRAGALGSRACGERGRTGSDAREVHLDMHATERAHAPGAGQKWSEGVFCASVLPDQPSNASSFHIMLRSQVAGRVSHPVTDSPPSRPPPRPHRSYRTSVTHCCLRSAFTGHIVRFVDRSVGHATVRS